MTPNKERIKLWVDALRSGEYQQGREQLRITEEDGGYRYCCLGVACDLFAREVGLEWDDSISDVAAFLPDEIAGLLGIDVEGHLPRSADGERKLWELNDTHCKTFAELADIIEAQYLGGEA